MSLTAEQVISTVLMRLGNRQGNAALAAQALLEYDLLIQEIYELPQLFKFLLLGGYETSAYSKSFVPNDPMYFSGTDTLDTTSYAMVRLASAQHDPHPVKILTEGFDADYVNEPLTPVSEDDWDILRQEDSLANSVGRPKYYLVRQSVAQDFTWAGGVFSGVAPYVLLYPYMADDYYQISFNGYIYNSGFLLAGAQNLLIAGLGKRMAPYVRDNNMLQLFEAQFQRELQKLYDRDTAIEEDQKPGLRGDLEDR